MGRAHAVTGAAAGAVTCTTVAPMFGVPAWLWVAGAVAGSILPDVDHPSASIAQMWGPVSRWPVRALSPLVGGHRGATHHPVVGLGLVVAGLWTAGAHPVSTVAGWVFLVGVFITAVDQVVLSVRVPWLVNLAVSAAAGWAAHAYGLRLLELVPALALGVVVHLVGDRVPAGGWAQRVVVGASYVVVAGWSVWTLGIRPGFA